MDTLFWTRSNPKILIKQTTKKYYEQYLYKLTIYSPAGRLIYDKNHLENCLNLRDHYYKAWSAGFGYAMHPFTEPDIVTINIKLLKILKDLRTNLHIRMRIEEPLVQLYAKTEDELQQLVNGVLSPFVDNIRIITGPQNEKAAAILDSGMIIRKKDIGYKYKMIFRDGIYTSEIKNNLLQYLITLGSDVKIPNSVRRQLSSPHRALWNGYIYINDVKINTFISLIAPGLIGKLYELTILADK